MKRYCAVFLILLFLLSHAAAAEPAGYTLPAVADAPVDESTYVEEPHTPYTPPARQAGRGEIADIFQYWEDNGYPEDVSYAFEAGGEVTHSPEGEVIYSWWEIGLVGADEARQQEILDLIAPTCLVEFHTCQYTHSRKVEVYKALAPLAEEDEHVLDVVFVRNSDTVVVAIAEGFAKDYAKELIGQYGPVVSVQEGGLLNDLGIENTMAGMGLDMAGNSEWQMLIESFTPLSAGQGPRNPGPFGGSYIPWLVVLAAAFLGGGALLLLRRRLSPVPVSGTTGTRPARRPSRSQVVEAVRQSAAQPDQALFRQILQKTGTSRP